MGVAAQPRAKLQGPRRGPNLHEEGLQNTVGPLRKSWHPSGATTQPPIHEIEILTNSQESDARALPETVRLARLGAMEGGLCYFHANPDKAAELGRNGGFAGKD